MQPERTKRSLKAPTRRSSRLTPPPGGWPPRRLTTSVEIDDLTVWVMPHLDNSERSLGLRYQHRVWAWLTSFTGQLIRELHASARSPTFAEHRERLLSIQADAKRLRNRLAGLDRPHGVLKWTTKYSEFYVRHIRGPRVHFETVDRREILHTPLSAFDKSISEELKRLTTVIKSGAGHQRLYERLFDDPRLSLAMRCAWLLREARGEDAAPATEGGAVHVLMSHIWRSTTGLDPEDYNLGAYAKKGAIEVRNHFAGKGRKDLGLHQSVELVV